MNFVDFARAHGVLIGDPCPSPKIRRCPTDQNPRKKNGAFFWDGQRGFVFAWDADAKAHWFSDESKPWTEADKAQWKAKRRAMDEQQREGQARAAIRAQELMRDSSPGPHQYLEYKGFPNAQGLVMQDGALLIPMRGHDSNAVQGTQVIRWIQADRKYEKKMLPGMKATGAVLRLGKPAKETCLVEGYATGLSVEAAARSAGLGLAVLVTFSDGNLKHVAPMVKGRAFVFADNDESQAGERAAKETGLPYCMSDVVGEDANDLHRRAGLVAVVKLLMDVRRAVPSG